MTDSEYFTWQFYTWEYRGRGLHQEVYPVALEPPFMPFIRHLPQRSYIDESKRPTWASSLIDMLKGKKEVEEEIIPALDYENLEAFLDTGDTDKVIFKLHFSKERRVSADTIHAMLAVLSATENAISFELYGNSNSITIQFVCTQKDAAMLESILNAYLPSITIQKDEQGLEQILQKQGMTSVISFALQEEFIRPIAQYASKEVDPFTGIIGLMETLKNEEQLGIQILFQGCVNRWSESIIRTAIDIDGKSFFADAPESPKLAQEKIQSPLFGVSIKAFVQANHQQRRESLAYNFVTTIQQATKSPFNAIVPVKEDDIQQAIKNVYYRTSHRTGMLLNAGELATLIHIPSHTIQSRKLESSTRKTKTVPSIATNKEYILGTNNHTHTETNVTISTDARLKHTHIIGATGTGKSTLIANLILQDLKKGIGVTLLDPHGDLVDDIIARLPKHRLQDVVLLDPSDAEFPVGLNILEAHSDIEKEILSSDLVASFRKFSTSWGDQMNTVLGNAIIAILESSKGGTLNDLRRFLIEQEYRNEFLETVSNPSIKYYWLKEYPLQKSNSIGSILTRLDTFLRPKVIRNMVVQQQGLDFEQLLNTNKIILVKLAQGLIGKENSYLLGSLIVSKLHQAAFSRQKIQTRNPYFIYIDEFQNFITPSITEMLSGVRKYNVGLVLSHQDLQQLQREDSELINSVLGNIYTRIVFRVGEPDAKKLQDGFSDFDYTDLQNLGRGEAVVRIEQPQYDTSLDTIGLEHIDEIEKEQSKQQVFQVSRSKYATPKDVVERVLYESLDMNVVEKKVSKRTAKKEDDFEENNEENTTEIVKDIEKNITEEISTAQIHPSAATAIHKEIQPAQVIKEEPLKERDTTHRYLQNLIKKMAESKDFVATIEAAIPNGQVDVLLTKDNQTIAIEICNTTDAEWEVHNIQKCIAAKFDVIVSLSGDGKQLEKIKKKCTTSIENFDSQPIYFFTPDALFEFLNQTQIVQDLQPQTTTMKGYRVSVQYDAITQDEMKRKRASVAQVVMGSLRKNKK